MSNQNRPQSPHFTIYRWPLSMTLSILHRMTGVALSVGLIALMVWLLAIASGETAYVELQGQVQTIYGRLLLIGWSFAFFFHLSNGVRHLVWDTGAGFEKSQAQISSYLVIISTVVLTLAYWLAL